MNDDLYNKAADQWMTRHVDEARTIGMETLTLSIEQMELYAQKSIATVYLDLLLLPGHTAANYPEGFVAISYGMPVFLIEDDWPKWTRTIGTGGIEAEPPPPKPTVAEDLGISADEAKRLIGAIHKAYPHLADFGGGQGSDADKQDPS